MKRTQRLRRPDQFQRARREGRSWDTPLLLLQAVANRRRTTRCGFVVSKRIGGAVERNRAKRRVREAVRLVYDVVPPGWDLVFVIRSPAVITTAFPQLQDTIERLLRRASLWRAPPTIE
ncbi:MAG: ribonuclease P protein component [Roseiflexaceae bacterium]